MSAIAAIENKTHPDPEGNVRNSVYRGQNFPIVSENVCNSVYRGQNSSTSQSHSP
jgi:hypothetical protein